MPVTVIAKIQQSSGSFKLIDIADLEAAGNWKLLYIDGSAEVVELALGADGTFLQANGVAAAPTFAALVAGDIPTVQTDLELRIPLANPIVASAATQLEDWIHKKPYNVGHRINKLYARAASNVGGDVTFKLQKNGTDITSATITIPSGARIPTSATPVAFTEADLADADVITVVQTTARTDAINISIYIYGDRDVVSAVA